MPMTLRKTAAPPADADVRSRPVQMSRRGRPDRARTPQQSAHASTERRYPDGARTPPQEEAAASVPRRPPVVCVPALNSGRVAVFPLRRAAVAAVGRGHRVLRGGLATSVLSEVADVIPIGGRRLRALLGRVASGFGHVGSHPVVIASCCGAGAPAFPVPPRRSGGHRSTSQSPTNARSVRLRSPGRKSIQVPHAR